MNTKDEERRRGGKRGGPFCKLAKMFGHFRAFSVTYTVMTSFMKNFLIIDPKKKIFIYSTNIY